MANVLMATLGDSPVVVTSMFNLLKEEAAKGKIGKIDNVIVLHPRGDLRQRGYLMIDDALSSQCPVEPVELDFDDVYNERESYAFLHTLFTYLYAHKASGNNVYLSLAGGRKNMSALMALAAPFCSCVRKLYHVLDEEKKNFRTVHQLWNLDASALHRALNPNIGTMRLVDIPFDEALQATDAYVERLLNLTPEKLQALWRKNPDEAEATQLSLSLLRPQKDNILTLKITEEMKDFYLKTIVYDAKRKEELADCFKQMRFADTLKATAHGVFPRTVAGKDLVFHFYRRDDARERPFYHTEPGDVASYPTAKVDTLIISGLSYKDGDYTQEGKELAQRAERSLQSLYPIEDLFIESADSVLVVPLGVAPMIATQMYTLLTMQGRKIHKVVLVYPGQADEVLNGLNILDSVFKHENAAAKKKDAKQKQILYRTVPVGDLEDIVSEDDCRLYQRTLEKTILELQDENPHWKIDLALSGGRKTMAALAVFAAQRTGLPYVYQTLIADKELDEQVQTKTSIKELNRMTNSERCEHLFLRAYKSQLSVFRLFKVPVGPTLRK